MMWEDESRSTSVTGLPWTKCLQTYRATTRELPGYYPFQVLQDLISCSSVQWEAPALALVESIHRIVLGHHEKLIKLHFGKYSTGGLQQFVSYVIIRTQLNYKYTQHYFGVQEHNSRVYTEMQGRSHRANEMALGA